MKLKNKKLLTIICMTIVLLIPFGIVFAGIDSVTDIQKDETISRDWFAFSQTVKNDGVIKGDLFSIAQYMSSSGRVEGDVLSAASDARLSGVVEGDARMTGANIELIGEVGKNVNLFANTVKLDDTSKIGGNLIAFANSIEVGGSINGHSRINGNKIVLNGNFAEDVEINLDGKFSGSDVVLHILPGTKIDGKLIYKGINEALVENGAQIKDIEWIKAFNEEKNEDTRGMGYYAGKYARKFAASVIYFLVAMLLFRLFPKGYLFNGRLIEQKPLSVFAVGLAAIALIIAAVITFIFLIAATVLIATPWVAFVFAAVMTLIYTLLFYFSTIPVSLWLGNIILKDSYSVPVKLGLGLLIITAFMTSLNILGQIDKIGIIFSAIRIIAAFVIGVMGIGTLLYSSGNALQKLRSIGND